MRYYHRFLCYDDPSRQTTTQIHPDIPLDDLVQFGYGQPVTVGDDADDPATWPGYVVANLIRMKQIDDPVQTGQKALLVQVYVVKQEEWDRFEVPELVQEILDRNRPKPENDVTTES